jgi:hypothetical protein
MTWFLIMFLLLLCRSYTSYAPVMVASSAGGASRPPYGCVFTVGGMEDTARDIFS